MGYGRLERVDVPVEIGAEQAAEMAEKLESGDEITLTIDPETSPDLASDIRWQLRTGDRILVYSPAYRKKELSR